MDYTQSDSFTTHIGTGRRMHDMAKSIPTVVSDKDINSLIWSLMEVVTAGGQTPAQFDPGIPGSYRKVLQAIQSLITTEVNAQLIAGALPAGINIYASFMAPPPGLRVLKRNGQAVPRSVYAALDAAIYCGDAVNGMASWGYRCYDPANPSTTRNVAGTHIVLPRANGRTGRVLSEGDALDFGRLLWWYQDDAFQGHEHQLYDTLNGGGGGYTGSGSVDWTRNTQAIVQKSGFSAPRVADETRMANFAETAWITY